ncbi:MAG: ribbon-helix-helix protein, CopG family [Thermoplasmata archaeon]|nr:ribbon-helix-helix protein, CopG family [Thermoplasmata archaeon]MCI4359217.1 ribbon-helix-helix protein, CopG family [Thermoplasmata archaeon]
MPSRVVRLGVSLEPELLASLDRWVVRRNSPSRSDAIRFLIRKELSESELGDPESDAVGAVMVLYRHTAPSVLRRLTSAQHRWGEHIQAATHFHLRGDACLEVMVLKGKRAEVERAAEDLRGVKGIIQGDYLVGNPTVAGGKTGHRHPHGAGESIGRSPRPTPARAWGGSRQSRGRGPPRPGRAA